jgi:thiamine biosynthesis lipoprotein
MKPGAIGLIFLLITNHSIGQLREVTHRTHLLGSWFEVTAVTADDTLAWNAIHAVVNETNRIDHLISEWDSTSQTTLINRNAGIKPVQVDEELYELIARSIKVSKLTKGAFDISFASMLKVWRFDGSMKEMPEPVAVKTAASKIGYQNIILDKNTSTVFLKEKGMKIGFGGIGQGYVANRGKKIMQAMGIMSGLVNVSGDICAWGKRADGSDWSVGIANPKNKDEIACWLSLQDLCLSTSGDYEKFVMFNGKRYSHIIDPRTGYPAEGVSSVTVVCPDAELSDALDTGIFVMGVEKGLTLINQLKNIECLIIDDKGNLHPSKNLKVLPQEMR